MPEDIITSSSPKGCVITMNVWVRADAESEMISVMAPVLTKLRADPNCLWLDACRNPRDPTHYRYVHGWKTDSKYFFEVSRSLFLFFRVKIKGKKRERWTDAPGGSSEVSNAGVVPKVFGGTGQA